MIDGDSAEGADRDEGFDPAARELCPDGGCVGVIGDDGRCRVCGRAGEAGAAPPRPAAERVEPAEPAEVEGDEAAPADEDAGGEDDRRLCPDGGCVGLIGPDGRCKVCGLAEGAAVE